MDNSPIDHAFSRRALFAGTGTVLASFCTPLIAGERIPEPLGFFAPSVAYAEDPSFSFTVASPTLVALKVVDVASSEKRSVAGARLTVANANGEGQTVTLDCDAGGTALLNLEDIYGPIDAAGKTIVRDLNVGVRASSCRPVDIGSFQVIGGKAAALPTCSLTDSNRKDPFFSSVTFNDCDILYSKAEFLCSSGNDERHVIEASLCLDTAAKATVSLYRWRSDDNVFPGFDESKGVVRLLSARADIDEGTFKQNQELDRQDEAAAGKDYDSDAHYSRWTRTVEFRERFLQLNNDISFKAGDRLVLRVESDGKSWCYLTNASFRLAPLSETATSSYEGLPGISSAGINFTAPDSLPYVGGSSVNIWLPTIPLLYQVDPCGSITLGYGVSAKYDTDKKENLFKGDSWKKQPLGKLKECWDNAWDDFDSDYKERKDAHKEMWQNFRGKNGQNQSKLMQGRMFPGFELVASGQAFGTLEFDWHNSYKGTANVVLGIGGEATCDFNVLVGPIPLFLAVAFNADAQLALRFGMVSNWSTDDLPASTKLAKLITDANISWSDAQAAFTINVGASVTAGVGVSGVGSVGVRGSASITLYIGFNGSHKGSDDDSVKYPLPHFRVGAGADVFVVVQAWLFKFNGKIVAKTWPTIVDSWGQDLNAAALSAGDDDGIPSKTGMPEEFVISAVSAAAAGGDEEDQSFAPDGKGNFAISLEDFAECGESVADEDLVGLKEFTMTLPASAAAVQDADEEPQLIAVKVPAAADGSTIETYNLVLDRPDSENGDENGGTAFAANAGATDEDKNEEILVDDEGHRIYFDEGQYDEGIEVSDEKDPVEIRDNPAGVAGVGTGGGFKPTVEVPFLTGVFSDGRVRVLKLGGFDVLLRIASGVYGADDARTRLTFQIRTAGEWSSPQPVSFDVTGLGGINRWDLYDYDFDACQVGEKAIAISLLSGTRADDGETDLISACTNPVTSVVVLGQIVHQPVVMWAKSWRSIDGGGSLPSSGDRYLTYAPSITCASSTAMGGRYYAYYLSGAFIYKRASADKILSSDTPAHVAGFAFRTISPAGIDEASTRTWATTSAKTFDLTDALGLPTDISALQIADATYRGSIASTVFYESGDGCGTCSFGMAYAEIPGSLPVRGELKVSANKGRFYQGAKKFYRRPRTKTTLLIDANGVLCEERASAGALVPVSPYDVSTDDSGATITPAIPPSFAFSTDGNFIVYTENKRGFSGFEYEDTGEPTEQTEPGLYRIMASRAVTSGGITLFTRPFVLCETSNPIDGIAAASADGGAIRIVAYTIRSMVESSCDYYEIKVPIVATVTPLALLACEGALFPGKQANMEATLRNDGNTQIQSVTLALTDDAGNEVAAPRAIELGPETVLFGSRAKPDPNDPTNASDVSADVAPAAPIFDSGFHNAIGSGDSTSTAFDQTAFDAHPLVAGSGCSYLAAGDRATIALPLDVPQEWEGTKTLRIKVCGITFVDPVGNTRVAAEGAGVTALCDESGSASCATIDGNVLDAAAEPYAANNVVTVALGASGTIGTDRIAAPQLLTKGGETDPVQPGENGGGTSGSNGKGSKDGSGKNAKGGGLPDTSDASSFAGMGALGALAVMAGAGLAAYNRRREQVAAEAASDSPAGKPDDQE